MKHSCFCLHTQTISLYFYTWLLHITWLTYLVSIHWHGTVQVILEHAPYVGWGCGEEFIRYPSAHPCFGGFIQSMQSLSGLSPFPSLSSRHLLGLCPCTWVQVILVHLPCGEENIRYPSAHPCFGGFIQSMQSLSGLSPFPSLSSRHLLESCSATRHVLESCSAIEITDKI